MSRWAFNWKDASAGLSSPTASIATSSSTASRLRSLVFVSLHDQNRHPQRRPRVHPFRDVHWQVDAAVAHRHAEVLVPVGAVQGVAAIGEIHHVRYFRYVVGLATDDAGHILLGQFAVHGE